MALALDNAQYLGATTSTSFTAAFTCTGTNLILHVGVFTVSGDVVTGVTYGGVSMTQIKKEIPATGQYLYLYELVAPATGANNVVVSASSSITMFIDAISHTGAAQTGQPDASNIGKSSSTTDFSTSVTTIADNCWLVMYVRTGTGMTAKAGTTLRSGVNNTVQMCDSNGAKTPAGSYSLGVTLSSASYCTELVVSIAPAVAAGIATQVNIGDVWKTATGVQINIGDVWKTVTHMQINIGDVWKSIF